MEKLCDGVENYAVSTSDKKGKGIVIMNCGGRFGLIERGLFTTHKNMADAATNYTI